MKQDGTGRRTRLSSIRTYRRPEEVFEMLHRDTWDYKINQEYFHLRDIVLGCLLYLTSGRINEVLQVNRDQFEIYKEDNDFILLKGFWVSKRARERLRQIPIPIRNPTGQILRYEMGWKHFQASEHPIIDIPLSLKGKLSPFAKTTTQYLDLMKKRRKTKLFPFKEPRAWQIINHITGGRDDSNNGVWPHWFRAQSLSYFVNLLRSTTIVAKERGVANPKTIEHYYIALWVEHKDLLKL